MDARFVHVGPSRIPPGHDREACLETYRRNAGQALALAGRLAPDAVLLVEQMNRVELPDALFASIDYAAEMVRLLGSARSQERRVGKRGGSTCKLRWAA